jgi:cytochrome d ubiquinol oxidase subunit II
LLFILLALIIRGVAFEFRSKIENPRWRGLWDGAIFIGSLIPALLWGVAFANLVRGVPIDASMNYVGGFWNLLNPFALTAGLLTLSGFVLHGAIYLSLKTPDGLAGKASQAAARAWRVSLVVLVAVIITAVITLQSTNPIGVGSAILTALALGALLLTGFYLRKKLQGRAFGFMIAAIVLTSSAFFFQLFPNLMISSLDPAWNLTITNSASGPTTLKILSIIALVLLPIVVAYQAWSYWIFRKRLTGKVEQLEY